MAEVVKKNKLLQHQKPMDKVLLSLIPCIAGAAYFFGWYCLFIIMLANVTGFITEYIFARRLNKPVSEAVFVTGTLFSLVMPPTVPWYVVVIGMIFAVMFGKMVFGGFGKNIFNPAIVGRAFVYICFPVAITGAWAPAADGIWGALDKWHTIPTSDAQYQMFPTTTRELMPDAISGATPMANLKAGRLVLDSEGGGEIPHKISQDETVAIKPLTLFKGLLLGRRPGTAGVTSVILICIGGIYLFITKTANRSLILSVIITYAVWNQLLNWCGVEPVPGAWPGVMGGGFLFGAFFMITDPVSAPNSKEAKILYGILIATSTMVRRNFSKFNGGLMYSILMGNMFAPTLDSMVKYFKSRKKTAGANA